LGGFAAAAEEFVEGGAVTEMGLAMGELGVGLVFPLEFSLLSCCKNGETIFPGVRLSPSLCGVVNVAIPAPKKKKKEFRKSKHFN
jgi:hypothetical protein